MRKRNPLEIVAASGLAPVQLVVSALELPDAKAVEIARVIAEETERQRDLLRIEYPIPHGKIPTTQRRGLLSELLNPEKYVYSYADSLRWDELLADTDCVQRVAVGTGLRPSEVAKFAVSHCAPEEWRALFWFGVALEQLDANISLAHSTSLAQLAERAKFLQRQQARGRKRHEGDPKQIAKAEVKEYFVRWQHQPGLYPSAAKFALDMLEKFEALDSPDVILRWVRAWRLASKS